MIYLNVAIDIYFSFQANKKNSPEAAAERDSPHTSPSPQSKVSQSVRKPKHTHAPAAAAAAA